MSEVRSDEPAGRRSLEVHQLSIHVAAFRSALKSLKHLQKKPGDFRSSQIAIEFDGAFAVITCPGAAITMNAAGTWTGRANFSINLILRLIARPPTCDPVIIKTDSRKIWIDGSSVGCSWQPAIIENHESYLSLPEPVDRLHMLQMLSKYGKDSLYQQGFTKHIRSAKVWRYRCVIAALEHLAPLGVSYDDLAHVVEQTLSREASKQTKGL